jgi:succinate-semialdehyde dehydrogenase/glutarate-semialdehyde dehydrogenase
MSRGITSTNPATGALLRTFDAHSRSEIERRLEIAETTFRSYRRTSLDERARWLFGLAELLENEKREHARTITLEMGKPIRASIQEIEKCALGCRYYAENGSRFLADEAISPVNTNTKRTSFVRHEPLGPILAVMPWNFPFWQLFRFAAPALMAGNVVLLKHASNVPQCALAMEDVVNRAGFPHGAFQTLLIGSGPVNDIIADHRIRAVTLTGSAGAGSSVASGAGKAIKKTVLELGGSDPFIVMPTADLERAVVTAVQARTINNGQSCIAAKRFIIHTKIADEFQYRFVERMGALKIGDPMDESTDIGPLATEEIRHSLTEQVNKTIELGGRLLLGGQPLNQKGFYFPPTVLSEIPPVSPAAQDELFGPVASLFRARDLNHAIEIANSTQFGLGSSAWTNDFTEREQLINELQAGSVFINSMVASDPRLPFGGIKSSGFGRELSRHGLLEFINIKTVNIESLSQKTIETE